MHSERRSGPMPMNVVLGSAFAAIHSQQPRLVKEGRGSNATGTADEEQEEPGADLLDKLEKGSGSTGRFITYYMETIFRAEPWWRTRNRDGAFRRPRLLGTEKCVYIGNWMHVDISHLHARVITLHYMRVCGWGRDDRGRRGWAGLAGHHTSVQSDRCA